MFLQNYDYWFIQYFATGTRSKNSAYMLVYQNVTYLQTVRIWTATTTTNNHTSD